MTSKGRARIVLVLLVVLAGAGVFLFIHKLKEDAIEADDTALTADAAPDASGKAAKAKVASKKKKVVRRANTKITGRGSAGSPPAHVAPPPPPQHHPSGGDQPAPPDEPTDNGGAEPAPPPRPHRHYGPPSGPSYESALGSNNQQINMGANSGADLTDAQLSGPMSDGSFVGDCDAPDDMGVTVKVAIKNGHAVGVSVVTQPHDSNVANCIDHHVRRLSWPSSPKMDSFVTTY